MAAQFNREGDINKAEDAAIIGGMQSRNANRKATVRRSGTGAVGEGTLAPVKKATISKVRGTLKAAGVSLGSGTSEAKQYADAPMSEHYTKKFLNQFKGVDPKSIETHLARGTFAAKATSPEEEQRLYVRAKAIANIGTSSTSKRKADASTIKISQDNDGYEDPSTIGQTGENIYTGPNSNPKGFKHLEELQKHVTTIEQFADVAKLPVDHEVRKHIADAHDSLGKAYLAHTTGDTTGKAGTNILGTGRGKGADYGIETSTEGGVGHARNLVGSIAAASRSLGRALPTFKEAGGVQKMIVGAQREFNSYKKTAGDNSGVERFDAEPAEGRLFPEHVTDHSVSAAAEQARDAYELTRKSFRPGARTVAPGTFSGIARVTDESGKVRATKLAKSQVKEPRIKNLDEPRWSAFPKKTAELRLTEKSGPLVGAVSPEDHAKAQAAWVENALKSPRGAAAAMSTKGASGGYTGEAKYRTHGYSGTSGTVKDYEKPEITPEMSARFAADNLRDTARTHFFTTQRNVMGGDKEFAKKVKAKPELQNELNVQYKNSQAFKNPAGYLKSVGKLSRSSEFKGASGV